MKAQIEVLSPNERTQVHERSLNLLATTGVRVMSVRGRKILKDAGADGDATSDIIRFPRALIEKLLKLPPGSSSLAAAAPAGTSR